MKESDEHLLDSLRNSYLEIINQFSKDNPGQSLEIILSSLIGTIVLILSVRDRKNLLKKELIIYSENIFNETIELLYKIKNEEAKKNGCCVNKAY